MPRRQSLGGHPGLPAGWVTLDLMSLGSQFPGPGAGSRASLPTQGWSEEGAPLVLNTLVSLRKPPSLKLRPLRSCVIFVSKTVSPGAPVTHRRSWRLPWQQLKQWLLPGFGGLLGEQRLPLS